MGRADPSKWHIAKMSYTLTAALIAVSWTGTIASASSHKAKSLSLSTVTFVGGSTDSSLTYVAQARGYYKQQGLTVNFISVTSGGSNIVAALVGGSAQFAMSSVSATAEAIAAGGQIRQIMMPDWAPLQEIALSQTFAAAHNIPTTGSTSAGAIAQIKALRGTHVNIAASTVSSDGYVFLYAVLKKEGLTIGPGADVNLTTLGSVSNLTTGFAAGKIDGFVNGPPTTVVANSIIISLAKIPPISTDYWVPLSTTDAMISQHPDTVQAFVNAFTEAYHYELRYPSSSQRIATAWYQFLGITSPEEITYLFGGLEAHRGVTPALLKSGWSSEVQVLDQAGTPLPVTFAEYADNKFVNKAITMFGYKYPLAK